LKALFFNHRQVHPHTHDWAALHGGHFNSDDNKCKRGNVARFERVLILLRDPFDSIWSEYQRRVSHSHVDGIPKKGFDWHRWQANAAAMSHSYHRYVLFYFHNGKMLWSMY
jgi:hypothetical protein